MRLQRDALLANWSTGSYSSIGQLLALVRWNECLPQTADSTGQRNSLVESASSSFTPKSEDDKGHPASLNCIQTPSFHCKLSVAQGLRSRR